MSIDHEFAIEQLGPDRMGLLKECLDTAWQVWESQHRPSTPVVAPGPMAAYVRELMLEQVRRRFDGVPGVRIMDNTTVGKRFLLKIDGKFLIQFRKLTKNFHTVNNPTRTSIAFDRQELVPTAPALPRVTAGYQLAQHGTSMAGTWLSFCIGKENVWHHDLRTGESGTSFTFPTPTGPSPADRDRVQAERHLKLMNPTPREEEKSG